MRMIIIAIVIIIMGNRCFIIFIAYKGLHGEKCPMYSDAELTMKEIIDICVFEKVNKKFVCRAVPQNVYYTTNFVMDLSKVDVSDITNLPFSGMSFIAYLHKQRKWENLYES